MHYRIIRVLWGLDKNAYIYMCMYIYAHIYTHTHTHMYMNTSFLDFIVGCLYIFFSRSFIEAENLVMSCREFDIRFHLLLFPQGKMLMLLLLSRLSRVQLCVTPWAAAHQAPLSTEFSKQEFWSGLPFLLPLMFSKTLIFYHNFFSPVGIFENMGKITEGEHSWLEPS